MSSLANNHIVINKGICCCNRAFYRDHSAALESICTCTIYCIVMFIRIT